MISILYKIYIKVNIHKKYTHAQQERQEGEDVCQMLTVVIRGVGRLGLISFSVLFSMFIMSHSENHVMFCTHKTNRLLQIQRKPYCFRNCPQNEKKTNPNMPTFQNQPSEPTKANFH